MIFKKQVYWVIYLFVLVFVSILILISLLLPPNYFIYNQTTILFLFIPLGGALFYQFLRNKHTLTITDNEIKIEGVLSNKSIKKHAIEGFETYYVKSTITGVGHYRIKQKKPSTKVIKIYPNYKNQLELTNWIKTNLIDLNKLNNEKEKAKDFKKDVFDAENLERDPIKRARKIQTAKRVKLVLNNTSILLALLFFFPFWNFDYLLMFIVSLPLIALISMFFLKGFLQLNLLVKSLRNMFNKKREYDTNLKSEYFSDVSLTFVIPSLLVLYLALTKYSIIDLKLIWSPAFVALLFIVLAISIQVTLKRLKFISLVFLIPFLMAYTYGSTVAINCVFDSSNESISKLRVVNKDKRQYSKQALFKRRYKYRVTLTNWMDESGKYKRVVVSQEYYNNIEIGDNAVIKFKDGLLNIPWYEVL